MKDKTKQNLVQLNFRTTPEAADALRQVAKKIGIKLEMITSDAIYAHYGQETREIAARRRLCVQALRELTDEGKVIGFPPTPSRTPAHGPCSDTTDHFTLKVPSENPLRNAIYGIVDVLGLSGVPQEMLHPLAV